MLEVIEMDLMGLIENKNPLLAETMEDHRSIGDSCRANIHGGNEGRNDQDGDLDAEVAYDDPDSGRDSMQIDAETLQMAGFGIPGEDF